MPLLASAAGALLWSPSASALDPERQRLLVDFGQVPWMQCIVRSEATALDFSWSIDEEETYPIPADEVVGGRRHQILAINRQSILELPSWLSQADIDDTAAVIEGFGNVEAKYIWDQSPSWPSGSWLRVTPDAQRVEITHAAAEQGASFETSGISTGVYQLLGYTYDPPVNVTSRAEGLLKVVDTANEAGAPALFVHAAQQAVFTEGEHLRLAACIDAAPDTSLRAYLGEVELGAEPNWEPVDLDATAVPERGEFDLELDIPYGWGGQPLRKVLLRVDAVDPEGATYTAYSSRFFEIAADPNGETGEAQDADAGGERSSPGRCQVGDTGGFAYLGSLGLLGLAGVRRRRARTKSSLQA